MNDLGICFEDGIGVQKSLEQAAAWFAKASERGARSLPAWCSPVTRVAGLVQGHHNYARMLEKGLGVPADRKKVRMSVHARVRVRVYVVWCARARAQSLWCWVSLVSHAPLQALELFLRAADSWGPSRVEADRLKAEIEANTATPIESAPAPV